MWELPRWLETLSTVNWVTSIPFLRCDVTFRKTESGAGRSLWLVCQIGVLFSFNFQFYFFAIWLFLWIQLFPIDIFRVNLRHLFCNQIALIIDLFLLVLKCNGFLLLNLIWGSIKWLDSNFSALRKVMAQCLSNRFLFMFVCIVLFTALIVLHTVLLFDGNFFFRLN